MEQAVTYFGAVGVDNIKRQHSYLSEKKQKTQFFFVLLANQLMYFVYCVLEKQK